MKKKKSQWDDDDGEDVARGEERFILLVGRRGSVCLSLFFKCCLEKKE